MQHKKIYLAGPIAGLSYGESALGWRAYVDSNLSGYYPAAGANVYGDNGIQLDCYSPMRGKGFLRDVKQDQILDKLEYKASPVSTTLGILGRDRHDTTGADVVFMNLIGAKKVSIGTMVELGWADLSRKPVILCMEEAGTLTDDETKNNVHEHLFVQGLVTYRVKSLDEGIACAKLILLPGE